MAKSVMIFVGIGLSVAGISGVHALLRSEELDVFLGMVKRKFGQSAKRFGGVTIMSEHKGCRFQPVGLDGDDDV